MSGEKRYIVLNDLEVYQLARELSRQAWVIYEKFDWNTKKVIGNQFIESADSVGANIAEGYGRYHYADKIKFYYISRGSLNESFTHWISLLSERNLATQQQTEDLNKTKSTLLIKLNKFIKATKLAKSNHQK